MQIFSLPPLCASLLLWFCFIGPAVPQDSSDDRPIFSEERVINLHSAKQHRIKIADRGELLIERIAQVPCDEELCDYALWFDGQFAAVLRLDQEVTTISMSDRGWMRLDLGSKARRESGYISIVTSDAKNCLSYEFDHATYERYRNLRLLYTQLQDGQLCFRLHGDWLGSPGHAAQSPTQFTLGVDQEKVVALSNVQALSFTFADFYEVKIEALEGSIGNDDICPYLVSVGGRLFGLEPFGKEIQIRTHRNAAEVNAQLKTTNGQREGVSIIAIDPNLQCRPPIAQINLNSPHDRGVFHTSDGIPCLTYQSTHRPVTHTPSSQ